MDIQEIKIKAIPILKSHDVEFAGVFGSCVRGEAGEGSDIDLVIRYSRPMGLEHVRLARELEESLGKPVDLVTEGYVYPLIKPYIAQDLKVLYGQRQFI